MEVDHVVPIVPTNSSLEEMSWDSVVDRIWCPMHNLVAVCKDCHKIKTKREATERRLHKKRKK